MFQSLPKARLTQPQKMNINRNIVGFNKVYLPKEKRSIFPKMIKSVGMATIIIFTLITALTTLNNDNHNASLSFKDFNLNDTEVIQLKLGTTVEMLTNSSALNKVKDILIESNLEFEKLSDSENEKVVQEMILKDSNVLHIIFFSKENQSTIQNYDILIADNGEMLLLEISEGVSTVGFKVKGKHNNLYIDIKKILNFE